MLSCCFSASKEARCLRRARLWRMKPTVETRMTRAKAPKITPHTMDMVLEEVPDEGADVALDVAEEVAEADMVVVVVVVPAILGGI